MGSDTRSSASTTRATWTAAHEESFDLSKEQGRYDVKQAMGFKLGEYPRKFISDKFAISKHSMKELKQERSVLESFVHSSWFENASGLMIFVNALCIGLDANARAAASLDRDWDCSTVWAKANLTLSFCFLVEVLFRAFALGWKFFRGSDAWWNWFDFIVILASGSYEVLQFFLDSSWCNGGELFQVVTALRAVRVLRLVRVIKAVRTMSIFRELRIMVSSTLRCMIPLFWAIVLLLVIQWIFGVYFVETSTDVIHKAMQEQGLLSLAENTEVQKLLRHYGTLWQALRTLFMSITGGLDWGEAADALFATTSETSMYHTVSLYYFYISLTVFAVLNVVTGVFVENAVKQAHDDKELIIQDELSRKDSYCRDALAVFSEADSNKSGTVTFQEFEKHLADKRVQAFFSCLELDAIEARRLFHLLDADNNGEIDADEFVAGCLCLKGSAKTMDVAALLVEVRRQGKLMAQAFDQVETHQARILQEILHDPEIII